jgi:hypothetical protein
MGGFWQVLKIQRWDDHRYYHHSLVNQSLHLLSATSFVFAYVLCYWNPSMAALVGWTVSMTSRQIGHFFFEPKGYDVINHATHEYKEEIKVGYNLRRKVVLLSIRRCSACSRRIPGQRTSFAMWARSGCSLGLPA